MQIANQYCLCLPSHLIWPTHIFALRMDYTCLQICSAVRTATARKTRNTEIAHEKSCRTAVFGIINAIYHDTHVVQDRSVAIFLNELGRVIARCLQNDKLFSLFCYHGMKWLNYLVKRTSEYTVDCIQNFLQLNSVPINAWRLSAIKTAVQILNWRGRRFENNIITALTCSKIWSLPRTHCDLLSKKV